MATRSRIGLYDPQTQTVNSIYCHWDGYPEHNGKILVKHYTDINKINELLNLGDISVLGEEIGVRTDFNNPHITEQCIAYSRDRGERYLDVCMTKNESLQEYIRHSDSNEEYVYLYVPNGNPHWKCYNTSTGNVVSIKANNEGTETDFWSDGDCDPAGGYGPHSHI